MRLDRSGGDVAPFLSFTFDGETVRARKGIIFATGGYAHNP